MQVLPKDTGWDTLTHALMTLYDAEIRNKYIMLHELNRQKQFALMEGNRPEAERLFGYKIPIANQFREEMPGSPIAQQLSELNPKQDRLDNLLQAAKSGTPSADYISELANAQNVGALKQRGEMEVTAQNEWRRNSRRSATELPYKEAGEAMGITIDQMKEAMQGKSDQEKMILYAKADSQLRDIAAKYPGRDMRGILPPLKFFLSGTGGEKEKTYTAFTGKKFGGRGFSFSSFGLPGSYEYENAKLRKGQQQISKDLTLDDIVSESSFGTGYAPSFSEKDLTKFADNQVKRAKDYFSNIEDQDIEPAERKKLFDKGAKLFGVRYRLKKNSSGNIETSNVVFDPYKRGVSGKGTTLAEDIRRFMVKVGNELGIGSQKAKEAWEE